jgi:transposase-like protein
MNERCPKCGSEAYLSEEEFAGNVENSDPPKAAIKQVFKCKSCGEKFSRIVFQNLDVKKKEKTEKTEAKKFPELFEGFHKPGVGLEEPDKIEVF